MWNLLFHIRERGRSFSMNTGKYSSFNTSNISPFSNVIKRVYVFYINWKWNPIFYQLYFDFLYLLITGKIG